MRRLQKSIVSLIVFQFAVTSMLVTSCGGETRLQNYVQWKKVGFFPSPIKDNGLVVIITKLEGDIVAYGLYGYEPTAGPNNYEFILSAAKTSVPMSLCLPKPTYISIGIEGKTDPKSKFDIVYDTSVTLKPHPCPTIPTTTTTTTSTTTTSTSTTSTTTTTTTVPTITTTRNKPTTTTTRNHNNTTTTLPTSTILTTTDDFGLEVGKNQTDDCDTFNARTRVVVTGLAFAFVSIIRNNFCNEFLDTY